MARTHLVVADAHSHPDFPNTRADWLSRLIIDLRPDVVVNLGDDADMASISSYDKGKRSFHGKSYRRDIDHHNDFQSRVWDPVKARKKRMPYRVILEGNHERRIEKALDLSPELEGTLGFQDYGYSEYYEDIIRYEGGTPGTITIDGVLYAHYLVSGVMGRPVSGLHPAASLNAKAHRSCVVGHIHTTDYSVATTAVGEKIQSLVAPCFFDYDMDWAGTVNRLYSRGVVILHDVEDGNYDPEWVSMNRLERYYA